MGILEPTPWSKWFSAATVLIAVLSCPAGPALQSLLGQPGFAQALHVHSAQLRDPERCRKTVELLNRQIRVKGEQSAEPTAPLFDPIEVRAHDYF